MASIPDSVVQSELSALATNPVSEDERKVACRAIVRFKERRSANNEDPVDVTEDWVRLYVALRRASGSKEVRLSASHLRKWRARVAIHDCEEESLHSQEGCLE